MIVMIVWMNKISAQENQMTASESNTTYRFYYDDLENFRTLLTTIKSKGDTLAAIDTYFDKASEGLKGWLLRYDVKPQRIRAALRYFPNYYDYLATLDDTLKALEPEITQGLNGLKRLYPSPFVHIPPIYYFILFGGGGSVEMTATMISIDYFRYHKQIDESEFERIGGLFPKGKLPLAPIDLVPQVVVHETVHLFQSYIQGENDYTSIYEDENRTVLAYLIREGSADFLTYLGAGFKDNTKLDYVEKHEYELWQLIKPILHDDPNDHPGWFSGASKDHRDWPFQIGYYLGFKIVEYYYEQATNKKEVIKEILSSSKQADFERFINTYRKKWN